VCVGCLNQADVVFLLDSSGSIDRLYFQQMLSFVSLMVNSFDVEGGAVQVGLATFSDNVLPAFNLSQYHTRIAIKVCLKTK
jgi:hypothetical protein